MGRAEALFLELADVGEAERDRRLDEACAADADLRAEVLSLLRHHDRAHGILDRPAPYSFGGAVPSGDEDATLPPRPESAGYRLRSVLGAGGMGVVYVAEQLGTRRTAALKVIRRSALSPSLVRRFEHEATLLARLRHPGIAQVYEAGVADFGHGSQPFIAMELVDGLSLADHADAHRLDAPERLELLARVADAVHHAHQRGIIHRDLKPGNILVEALPGQGRIGQPKLLYFGVARIDGAAAGMTSMGTGVGQLVGTLPYMSPEQVAGEGSAAERADIDTRSDVYALGVLLHRLLAGRLPHDLGGRSLAEAARIIRDEPAPRLSLADRRYARDVQAIANRALEKDRELRYATAGEFAADLRRTLANEPIEAHPATTFYYLRKFVRRNRGMSILSLALAVAVAGGTVTSIVLGVQATIAGAAAREAQGRAESRSREADEAAGRASYRAYLANISAAAAALASFDASGAGQALAAVDERDRRRWEWRYLDRSRDLASRVLLGPGSAVYAVAVSPDGTLLASGSFDRVVRLWDSRRGSLVAELTGHQLPVTSLAFSPDGARLASASADRTARVWEVATGRELARCEGHGERVDSIAWSGDGSMLMTAADDRTIRFWNAGTGRERDDWRITSPALRGASWSPDGALVAAACDDSTVRVWPVGREGPMRTLDGHRATVVAVAFSPDGRWLASGSADRSCVLWSTEDWTRHARMEVGVGGVRSLAFSADGRRIALGGSAGAIAVHETEDGRTVGVLVGHTGTVAGIAWEREGRWLASCSTDRLGSIRMWDGRSIERPEVVRTPAVGAAGIGLDAAGTTLAVVGSEGRFLRVDVPTGSVTSERVFGQPRASRAWWATNGSLAIEVTSAGAMRMMDPAAAEPLLWTASLESLGAPTEVCLHADASLAAIGLADGGVVAVDLRSRTIAARLRRGPESPAGPIRALCMLPRSPVVLFGDGAGGLALWQPGVDEEPRWIQRPAGDGSTVQIEACAVSDDESMIAAVGGEGSVRLWDRATGALRADFGGSIGVVRSLAFSHDGTRLACGAGDGTIRLWDVASGVEVLSLRLSLHAVTSLRFSAGDDALLVGSADRFVRILRASSARDGLPSGPSTDGEDAPTIPAATAPSSRSAGAGPAGASGAPLSR